MKEYNEMVRLLGLARLEKSISLHKLFEDEFKSPRQLFLEKEQNITAPEGWCRKYAKKEIAIKNISKHHFSNHIFDRFRDDKEVVKAAIEQYPKDAIHYCSRRMQADREVVEFAISKYGDNFSYACPTLQNVYSIALEAVKNGAAIHCVSDRLKDDKGFMTEVVRDCEWRLMNASERLKDDRELVMVAVKGCGTSLKYASDRLKDDLEVVLEALKNDKFEEALKNDKFEEVLKNISDRLQRLCEGKDPVIAIQTEIKRLEAVKLEKELSNKRPVVKRTINKI